MDETNQRAESPVDDPLEPWRVRASDSVTLGVPGGAGLISFERSSSHLALPFSSLSYAILSTEATLAGDQVEELKLVFASHVVTIWGYRLSDFLKSFAERAVVLVRISPPSASLLENKAVVVKELKWSEVRKESDEKPA